MLEDYEGSQSELMKMLAEQNATPAYIMRAQRVEGLWRSLLVDCRAQRDELLEMPKLRLAQLSALVDGNLQKLTAFIPAESIAQLESLFRTWRPTLRMELNPTNSPGKIRGAIRDLTASFERFNNRWTKHVQNIGLSELNFQREQYNDYYLVEKAAALDSDKLAEHGFKRLNPATAADILADCPTLPIPPTL